jgi:hypothetical protein
MGGLGINTVHRRLLMPPDTGWYVRAEGKDPLDRLEGNLSAFHERLKEGSLSLPIRPFPGEQAQTSDLIAPKSHPTPESLLGLQPAIDTCGVYQ